LLYVELVGVWWLLGHPVHISYKANFINNSNSTKFLCLTFDSTLSWKTHIDQLSSKLNSACYIIRSHRSIISSKNLRTIYFSYLHSIITYDIIFWGNSPYSNNIFKLQKRAHFFQEPTNNLLFLSTFHHNIWYNLLG
jgi:hypothetical protein